MTDFGGVFMLSNRLFDVYIAFIYLMLGVQFSTTQNCISLREKSIELTLGGGHFGGRLSLFISLVSA